MTHSASLRTGLASEDELTRRSYYLASAPEIPAFPQLQGTLQADVCVVGGGLAGISTALELHAQGYSVVLLEGQRVGWGASGRNGGQTIVGHASEAPFVSQLSQDEVRTAWDVSVEGLHLVRERISKYQIDCDFVPGWMYLAVNDKKARALEQEFAFTRDTLGYTHNTWIPPEKINQYIDSPRFKAGWYDSLGGHLHPLKYTRGLAQAAAAQGVQIFENSRAVRLERGEWPRVLTEQGEVRCRFIALAGNCYLNGLAPELNSKIMPVGTYIVTTQPLAPALAQSLIPNRAAVCDSNFVLDYFRLTADHRVLFGGRVSYSTLTPPNLEQHMKNRVLATFPQLAGKINIEYAWGGFVDITMNRAPDFGRLSNNIYYLQGFSGHGLALTGIAGKILAHAIAGQSQRFDVYARLKHLPFPGGKWLRTPALVLGMLWYRLRDCL